MEFVVAVQGVLDWPFARVSRPLAKKITESCFMSRIVPLTSLSRYKAIRHISCPNRNLGGLRHYCDRKICVWTARQLQISQEPPHKWSLSGMRAVDYAIGRQQLCAPLFVTERIFPRIFLVEPPDCFSCGQKSKQILPENPRPKSLYLKQQTSPTTSADRPRRQLDGAN